MVNLQDPIDLFITEFSKLFPDNILDFDILEDFINNRIPNKVSKSPDLKENYKNLLKQFNELLNDVKKETNKFRKSDFKNEEVLKSLETFKTYSFNRRIEILLKLNSLIEQLQNEKIEENKEEKDFEMTIEKSKDNILETKVSNPSDKVPEIKDKSISFTTEKRQPEVEALETEGEPITANPEEQQLESETPQISEVESTETEGEPITATPEVQQLELETPQVPEEIPEIEGEPVTANPEGQQPELETPQISEVESTETEGEPVTANLEGQQPELETPQISEVESTETEGEPITATPEVQQPELEIPQVLEEIPEIEGEPIPIPPEIPQPELETPQVLEEIPEIEGKPIPIPPEIPQPELETPQVPEEIPEIEDKPIPIPPEIPQPELETPQVPEKASEIGQTTTLSPEKSQTIKDFSKNIPAPQTEISNVGVKTTKMKQQDLMTSRKIIEAKEEITTDYKVKEEIPRPFLSDISPREIFENIIKSDPKIAKLLRKSTGQEDFNSLYEEAINNLKNNELETALQLFEKCIDKSILPEKDKRRKMINEKIINICKKLAKIKYEEGGRSYKNKKYEEAINLWKNAKKYYKKAELSNKAEEIQKIIDKTIKKFNLKVDNEPEIILIDESK
ncbi:MAG: hypothetical protein ACTSUG_03965 [Candidatus Helarchaeota archaeon]